MATAGRRAKFSVVLWPSLYSLRALLTLPLAGMIVAGFIALLFYLGRQNERQLISRAQERTKAVMALKLSGAERWQWKRELTCEGQKEDCLKVEFSFALPQNSPSYAQKSLTPRPCRICHEQDPEKDLIFYAIFPEIPRDSANRIVEWLLLGLAGIGTIAAVIYLIVLRRGRRQKGICIAAFEHDAAADTVLINFLHRLATSRWFSYYGEINGHRVRIATTPEKFGKLLEANRGLFESYRGSLRLAALHVDFDNDGLLPIEVLRGVFQFLKRTPPRTYLLHERLSALLGENHENGRRLVFKNKSGALLKFVPWESL